MKGFELEGVIIGSDVTTYGPIGIIGLGSDASCQLDKFDFLASNKILTYNSYKNIDQKSVKDLCDASDVILLVINLDDSSVGKSIWGLISYLESLSTNTIIVAKTSHASLNLATTIKKRVPFMDLSRQENSDVIWTLKNLHRVIYYYNEEYTFKDANYPPSMFWETFFKTNSEIFLYHGDNESSFLERMDICEQMHISKHCLLSGTNEENIVTSTLVRRIEVELNEESSFYIKNEEFDDSLLFLSV